MRKRFLTALCFILIPTLAHSSPPGFNFSLANGGNQSVVQGATASNTITTTLLSGKSRSVSFSASGLPSGATATFSPTACTPTCATTLTLTTTTSTPTGPSTITVTGSGGGLTRTTSFTLTVTAPPPPAFDFSLSNSGDQSVVQGATVSNTITATLLSGTSQSVVFSASGLPAGANATFSPTACTPTCVTTLTIATTASTPTSSSIITVTGSGGGLTRTTTFTLTVTAPPPAFDFSLSNSGDQTVVQGATVSNTITATLLSGTSQSVIFSASGLPAGASATFSPTACTPTCTTTLTLTTSASTPTDPSTITVTGTAGGLSHPTTFTLTVTAPPPAFDFSLANSGDQSVVQGAAVSNTITATLLSGTSQSVVFTAAELPAGASATFSPTACTPTCTTTLTLTTSASTPTGPSTITVTGTAGGLSHPTTFTLTVTAPPPVFDFSLSNGGDQAVVQGATASNTITATLLSGTSQSVSFSAAGLPAGANATFSPTACTPTCTTTLTLTTTASTPTGPSTITVTGTAGGLSHPTSFTLTVTAPPPVFDFSLTNSGDQSVVQGASVSNTITATLLSGASQAVSFTVSDLPPDVLASFSPATCSPTCTTTLTLSTSTSTPAGAYPLTVTGSADGGPSHTTSFTLTVTAPPPPAFDFSLINGGDQSVTQGTSASATITATLISGTAQAVSFATSGLPAGATAAFSPTACAPNCSSLFTLSTTASTPTGAYTLMVTGTGGGVTRTTSFSLTVIASTATTYYVATTGNDSNTCVQAQTPSTPKQTINAALNCLGTAAYAGAGQTVQVAAGTYTETLNNNLPGGSSWSAPFTLKAATIGTVIIQPPVGADRCVTLATTSSQYTILSGLVCDGVNISAEGIKITDSSFGTASFIRLQDVEIKNAKHHGLLVTRSTDNEFIRLTVHDNGTTDDADHGIYISEAAHRTLIANSIVYNNHAAGILVYNTTSPPDGCIVRNNRSYTNGTSGLVLSATNTLVYNNVIYNNHTAAGNLLGSAKSGLKVSSSSTGVKLYNNTVYGQKANNSDKGIEVASGAANTEVRNTIAYNNAKNLSNSGTNTLLTNNVTTDPKFVDAPNTDFHLQATSPAIDAGATLPTVPTDYDGNPRPQGAVYDIGAYEFGSGAAAFAFAFSNGFNQVVTRGASVSIPLTTTLVSGTAQALAFTASGLPSSEVITSFAPASCLPPCTTTLTLSPSASTPIGTYTLTVAGTAGSGSKTTSFPLTVTAPAPPLPPPPGETPANFTVAFIGDQGLNSNSGAVLLLIKNKGAQLVIHSGDVDYYNEPTAFDNMVTHILGSEFPYLVSRGNHDISTWGGPTGYQALLQARIDKYNTDPAIPSSDRILCTGSDPGLKSSCTYRGLRVLLIDPRAFTDEDLYIRQELATSTAIWNICSWHYDQTAMQVGGQTDLVGWADYEECRKGGAIIATAHEHSYARTRTLSNTQTQTVDAAWPDANTLRVVPGSTFVFHAGLGGLSVASQSRCLPTTFPYGCNGEWAKIYTSSQTPPAQYGALFITFNVDGDPKKARGEFFNITTPPTLVDSFTITADPFASPP